MKDMTHEAAHVKRVETQDVDDPPRCRTSDSLEFLYAALGKSERVQLLTIPEDGGAPKGAMFTLGDDDGAIVEYVKRARRNRLNVYFSTPRLKRDMTKKASKADVEAARVAHADIDPPASAGEQHDDNPEYVAWREATIDRLLKLKPTPLVVDSGGGVWALWPLKEGETVEDVEMLNKHLERAFMDEADGTWNVDRIARLPGSVNWPDKKKRAKGRVPRLAEFVGPCDDDLDSVVTMTVGELAESLGVDMTKEPERPKGAGATKKKSPRSASAAKLPEDATGRALTASGAEWEGEIGSPITNPKRHGLGKLPDRLRSWIFDDPEPGDDRSKLVYAVACALLRREIEPGKIAAVLLSEALPISAHAHDQKNPERAVRRVLAAAMARIEEEGVWPDGMVEKPAKSGRWVPTATLANTVHAIRRLDIDTRYDIFRRKMIVGGHAVDEYAGELQDEALIVMRNLVREATPGFDPGEKHIFDAVLSISQERRFNPVLDYLDGLKWDGRPRLRTWLADAFEAGQNEYTAQLGAIIVRAMVRRAEEPGAKFDLMAIAEGRQGTRKSSAIRALCPVPDLFSEAGILGKEEKVLGELLQGVWLQECAELEGISKKETGELKAMITRQSDRFRTAWGKVANDKPRTAIFFGSTNQSNYLRDESGNRRFAPFKSGLCDPDWVVENRDQLFAEAMHLESSGGRLEPLDFTGEAKSIHEGEADDRMIDDPLADQMAEHIKERDGWVMLKDIAQAMGMGPADLRNPHQTQPFARALRSLGFEQQSRTVNGAKKRVYVRDREGRLGERGEIELGARLVATP